MVKERYTLYFTESELANLFSRYEVSATLRLLERFGLIVYVQVDEEDGWPTFYYRRVTNSDVISGHSSAELHPDE